MSQQLAITHIVIREMQMKLKNPLTNSITTVNDKRFLIVEAHDQSGKIGYGESVAFSEPWYTEETTETCLYMLKRFLIPLLQKHQPVHPQQLEGIFTKIHRNHMAKSALECAIWDLYAKINHVSLGSLIGSRTNRVEAGISLGITKTPEKLLDRINHYVQLGYKRIKLKIQPGWDYHILELVRERFPQIPLMVDANGAYSIDDFTHLQSFSKFQLDMFEQPFPVNELLDHQHLVNQLNIPICLDESIDSYLNAKLAITLQCTEIITLKIGRVGGISESLKIMSLCKNHDVPLWIGGMFETGIGRAFNVIVASAFHNALPGDIGESSHYWYEDLIHEPFVIENGYVQVPGGVGIGVTVNKELLNKYTVDSTTYPVK